MEKGLASRVLVVMLVLLRRRLVIDGVSRVATGGDVEISIVSQLVCVNLHELNSCSYINELLCIKIVIVFTRIHTRTRIGNKYNYLIVHRERAPKIPTEPNGRTINA